MKIPYIIIRQFFYYEYTMYNPLLSNLVKMKFQNLQTDEMVFLNKALYRLRSRIIMLVFNVEN